MVSMTPMNIPMTAMSIRRRLREWQNGIKAMVMAIMVVEHSNIGSAGNLQLQR